MMIMMDQYSITINQINDHDDVSNWQKYQNTQINQVFHRSNWKTKNQRYFLNWLINQFKQTKQNSNKIEIKSNIQSSFND